MKHLRPAYELRQKFAYNNQVMNPPILFPHIKANPLLSKMFTTGAHIVKKYSPTRNYPDFVNDRIFAPLGMKSSTFSPGAAKDTGNLTQSWTAHSQRIPFWYTDSSVDMIAGAGGIITNVVDLVRRTLPRRFFVLTSSTWRTLVPMVESTPQ